jgi:hypothetical protein
MRGCLRWKTRNSRRRLQESAASPNRYVLIVTPEAATQRLRVHIETGSDHWKLLDRGGDVAMRWGVPCVISTHDLDESDIESGTVAWLPVDADGHVTTRPPRADAHETVAGTNGAGEPTTPSDDTCGSGRSRPSSDELRAIALRLWGSTADLWTVTAMPEGEPQPEDVRERLRRECGLVQDPISRVWFSPVGRIQ